MHHINQASSKRHPLVQIWSRLAKKKIQDDDGQKISKQESINHYVRSRWPHPFWFLSSLCFLKMSLFHLCLANLFVLSKGVLIYQNCQQLPEKKPKQNKSCFHHCLDFITNILTLLKCLRNPARFPEVSLFTKMFHNYQRHDILKNTSTFKKHPYLLRISSLSTNVITL